jgi:anti-sigma B factor antagonist
MFAHDRESAGPPAVWCRRLADMLEGGRYDMPLNIEVDGDVVVLSSFGRLMNDPRYVDASRDVSNLLDQGLTNFILDLDNVRETGDSFLGLLMTITRRIRRHDGEVVLARLNPHMEKFIDMMKMDDYWDIFKNVAEAKAFFSRDST